METVRSRALKGLALPTANPQVAQGMQAARLMGLQRAVASTTAPAGRAEVQQAGAQQAAAAGGIAVDAAKQAAERTGQLGQLAVADQQTAAVQDITQRKAAVDGLVRRNESEMAALGRDLKQRVFDDRMKFERDEAGRARMNEYQLADWAVTKAKNDQELRGKMQAAQLGHQRRMQLLEVAHKRIVQEMENISRGKIIDQNGETMKKLAEAKAAAEEKMRREAADAANKQQMWQTGGTVIGGVVGAVVGGPVGAGVGMAAGGAVGTLAGQQANRLGV